MLERDRMRIYVGFHRELLPLFPINNSSTTYLYLVGKSIRYDSLILILILKYRVFGIKKCSNPKKGVNDLRVPIPNG